MNSILIIGAHPDDETMIAGGVIALLVERGLAVHILCATRGEGGEAGDPPLCAQSELGAVREAELRCAVQALGARSLRLLNYVDPFVGPDEEVFPFEADFNTLAAEIQQAIRQVEADGVISHGPEGEYGHPAHQLIHRAVRAAVESLDPAPFFYSFAAQVPGNEDRIWNKNTPAHLALDVRPWLDAKEAAALCHRTQHALFLRHHPGQTVREALRTLEAFHRHLPPVDDLPPDDPFAALLLAAGAWSPEIS
jgi:LmbE family N-acetylglucosaminyl deacetylase